MSVETLKTVLEMNRKLERALRMQRLCIKAKKLRPDAVFPYKATEGAAAYDVLVPEDFTLHPGRQIVPLGIAVEIPWGYEAKIEPRSGFSSKGMTVMDYDGHTVRIDADVLTGKIDSDYRGGIGVIVCSRATRPYTLPRGTRIAQMTIYKVEDLDFVETDELSDTERGSGGFGSSGA